MIRLNYLVLRCRDLSGTKRFYEALGLSFQEEKHGAGPIHFSTCISGVVVELYPLRDDTASTTDPCRIGITVDSVSNVVPVLETLGMEQYATLCFRDPDGRIVELSEV